MTNNIQGNSHKVISCFLNRNSTSQKGMAGYIESDERAEKGRAHNQEYSTEQDSPSDLMKKSKYFCTRKS